MDKLNILKYSWVRIHESAGFRAEIQKYFVRFWVQMKTVEFAFEIK